MVCVKAGPKAAVDPSPLPFRSRKAGAERVAAFCAQFVTVPKGSGARRRLRLRPWQVNLVASVFGVNDSRPRLAGWMLPRGQGKTTLCAALGLYDLMLGEEGASVVVAARDERQANLTFSAAARMVELDERLAARVQVYKDRLTVPGRGASFQVLPAEPRSLEGLDPTLALIDEIGVVARDVYEVVALASGKREHSTVLGIGTPGPDPHDSVLLDMRRYAAEHPDDTSMVWREHSAAAFPEHPVDCAHCWELANPALGDFLHEDALTALLPPKTREATFRRARLCQFVRDTEGRLFPEGAWDACKPSPNLGEAIPDGAEVVLALDGSFNGDATGLLAATVSATPHVDKLALWEPPKLDSDYRVPVADVEQTIREACKRWRVVEIIADPFRWTRTLQALEAEGLPVVEFPQSPNRLTAATSDLYRAVTDREITHDGDPDLARHVGNAVVVEDTRGARIAKERKHSTNRIDLAACLVMAHSRATWRARKHRKRRAVSFR